MTLMRISSQVTPPRGTPGQRGEGGDVQRVILSQKGHPCCEGPSSVPAKSSAKMLGALARAIRLDL
jgi:hypothetical protein